MGKMAECCVPAGLMAFDATHVGKVSGVEKIFRSSLAGTPAIGVSGVSNGSQEGSLQGLLTTRSEILFM